MTIPFRDTFSMIQELTGLRLHLLHNQAEMERFCATYRFHSIQSYLTPESLDKLFSELAPNELLAVTDPLRIRFLFVNTEGYQLVIGPYCGEVLSEKELCNILPEAIRAGFPSIDCLTFRNQFPVMDVRDALRHAQTVLRHLCVDEHIWQTRFMDYGSPTIGRAFTLEVIKSPVEVIEDRYRIEQAMVEHIKAGRASAAIECYLTLERSGADVLNIGPPLERARTGAATTRTTVRHAAFDAGLPVLLIDKLSNANLAAVSAVASVEEISRLVQGMIRSFCNAIYQMINNNYSKLILCMIYTIEHEYQHDLSVTDLAEELGVTTDYLTKRCKQERGITPKACIRKVRMEKAAQLLRQSNGSVQEISAEVGIMDANYFVKLFKQEYGVTPTAYRAERLL